MKKKIKWVIFDVSGVITHFTFTNPKGYKIGNKLIDSKKLESLYFTDEYKDYMIGKISHDDFIKNYFKRNKLDLTAEEFNRIFENDLTPTKGLADLISQLSRKYKIALATNEGEVLSKYRIEKSGIKKYISRIIASYEIKELKPSTNFFKKTLERLKAKPNECVFIDDDIKNVDSAKSLGIISILFKDTNQLKKELINLKIIS